MLDLTALEKVLKEVYVPAVREQMKQTTLLLSQVKQDSEIVDGSGKYAVIPLLLSPTQAIGARGEMEDLPEAKSSRYDRLTVPIATTYGTIKVSGHAIRASQSDAGSYVRAVDSEMKNLIVGLKRDISRQLYGDGSGKLATISAVATNVLTVGSDVNKFVKGMLIEVYDVSGTPTSRGTCTVTSVDEDNETITVDEAPSGTAADDIIVRQGSYGKEMHGLDIIVNNNTYILDPSSVPEWKANIVTAGSGYNLLVEMQKAYTKCEKKAEAPNLIITTYELRDAYANALTTARRIVNTVDLEWGFKGLDFNGKAVVADDQAPAGKMFFINTANLVMPTASDFDWGDEDGKILTKVPNKDAYTAFMYFAANLATDRRNAHSLLTNL